MKIIDKLIRFFYSCLFFITPLLFAFDTSELFEFNKILFIYLLTIFIGFFWFIKMILTKKIIIKKTFLDWPILIFLLSQILSTIFSIDPHTSFFGYYSRFNGGLLSIISYIILFYGFVSNINDFKFVLKTTLFSSFLVIIYAVPGKLGHDVTCFLASSGKIFDNSCWSNDVLQFRPELRAFSTLGQPNWFGAYLAINFFIGLYFLIKEKLNIKYFFYLFYLFLNFTFILFTRSRSSLLAVIIGLSLFMIGYWFLIKKNANKLILLFLIIIIIPIILFKTGINKIDQRLDNIKNVFNKKNQKIINIKKDNQNKNIKITDSADIRKIVWQGAIRLGLQYPIFGTGVETFAYSYYFVRPIAHNYTSEWDFVYNKAHNEFLNYLATTGFFGLTSYLWVIFSFIFYFGKKTINQILKKNNKKNQKFENRDVVLILSLLISYLTILITNFFGFSTTTINLFFYLIPAILIIYLDENKNYNDSIQKLNIDQYIALIIVFFVFIYLLVSLFFYRQADVQYNLANNYLKIQNYSLSYDHLKRALQYRTESVYEDKFSTVLTYLALISAYQKQESLTKELMTYSQSYNQKTLNSSPKNIFYLKTKAKNQYYYYQITNLKKYLDEGVNTLVYAQKIAPTDPKIPYSLAVFYLELANTEKSINQKRAWYNKVKEAINQSLKLKSDYQDVIELRKEMKKIINN